MKKVFVRLLKGAGLQAHAKDLSLRCATAEATQAQIAEYNLLGATANLDAIYPHSSANHGRLAHDRGSSRPGTARTINSIGANNRICFSGFNDHCTGEGHQGSSDKQN